jgi:hypothetical protein
MDLWGSCNVSSLDLETMKIETKSSCRYMYESASNKSVRYENKIYLIGDMNETCMAEVYDIEKNEWKELASFKELEGSSMKQACASLSLI